MVDGYLGQYRFSWLENPMNNWKVAKTFHIKLQKCEMAIERQTPYREQIAICTCTNLFGKQSCSVGHKAVCTFFVNLHYTLNSELVIWTLQPNNVSLTTSYSAFIRLLIVQCGKYFSFCRKISNFYNTRPVGIAEARRFKYEM